MLHKRTLQIADHFELRLKGQDTPLQVEFKNPHDLPELYRAAYERLFGYPPPANREIELVSIRTITRGGSGDFATCSEGALTHVLLITDPSHPGRLLHHRHHTGLERGTR
jgi:hypothetical protein